MSLNNATLRVEMGANLYREAGETLMKIVQGVDSLQSMLQPIAAPTEEMSSVSEHDSNDVQGIAHSYRRNINRSEQICPSLFQHRKAWGEFMSISDQFKI
jgi:methyl-accepting chemotaxis protein